MLVPRCAAVLREMARAPARQPLLEQVMFSIFERWVDPFPPVVPVLPRKFLSFVWICSRGMRRYIGAMMLLTAIFGAFEAWLFSALGQVVDWLGEKPAPGLGAGGRAPP